jgi:hypothetical protein
MAKGSATAASSSTGVLLRESTLRVRVIRQPALLGLAPRAEPVSLVDVTPTLLDLLGIPAARQMDGVSLAGLIREGGAPPPPRSLYFETLVPQHLFGWASLRGVRSGPLKYVEAPGTDWRALYDLEADPGGRGLSARSAEMGRSPRAPPHRGDLPDRASLRSRRRGRRLAGAETAPRTTGSGFPATSIRNAALQARRSLERGGARRSCSSRASGATWNYSGSWGGHGGHRDEPARRGELPSGGAGAVPGRRRICHQPTRDPGNKGPGRSQASSFSRRRPPGAFERRGALRLRLRRRGRTRGSAAQRGPGGYRDFAHIAVDPDMAVQETARFRMITRGRFPRRPPPGSRPRQSRPGRLPEVEAAVRIASSGRATRLGALLLHR